MSRTNYIFVDFENVQEIDLSCIANKPIKVSLILGVGHKSLPVKLVKVIQRFPQQVQLVETTLSGKNALDFVLAYEVGIESSKDPGGYFHILSRDKGFDALISYLRTKGVLAARHASFSEIPMPVNLAERVKIMVNHLKANQVNRPKKQKTLSSQIQARFGKVLSEAELEETIKGLITSKAIEITPKGEIVYRI